MKYEDLRKLIESELVQREEEGCNITGIKAALSKIKRKAPSKLKKLLNDLSKLSVEPNFPYTEPSDLLGIRKERPEGPRRFTLNLSENQVLDKIKGGWFGRCAGCLLGKPVEGLHKEQIEKWLEYANEYPLTGYFPLLPDLSDAAPDWLKKRNSRLMEGGLSMMRGHITYMPRDDDMDYPIFNLHLLESKGFDFTASDVGSFWLNFLPYGRVYTAERIAYKNLVNNFEPPETAVYTNPYREWIGAQIRGDMFGYVTPGMPELGADFAFRDASLSHVKNGIYGEMLVTAMISTAFTTNNIEEIIEIGLSEIPKTSRLSEAVKDMVAWSKEYSDWKEAWNKVNEKYGHYHVIHTINNALIVLLGLLYGKGDYEKTITISVMGGWDTDCNGATAGSILGIILGSRKLPEKWVMPLNNTVESYVIGFNKNQISNLAERTFKLATKILRGEVGCR